MVLLRRAGTATTTDGRRSTKSGAAAWSRTSSGCPTAATTQALRGLERFQIVEEDHERSYRRAIIEPLREQPLSAEDGAIVRNQRAKLESMLSPAVERAGGFPKPQTGHAGVSRTQDSMMPSAMSDEDLVNALAQYLDFEPLEKQALLEKASLRARAESLVELLEMKIMIARTPGLSNVAH
jgi:Lon protease-like protein